MSRYRVVIGACAEAQVDAIARWWAENRPDAPGRFLGELAGALDHLGELPEVGIPYPAPRPPGIRRVLLRGSRHHIYYTVHQELGEVRIRAVWHAARGNRPRLANDDLDDE